MSSDPTGPGISNVAVHGGAGGTEAQYDDLAAMGRLTDDIAGDTLGVALRGHKFLAEPDVIASALLDPGGAARFEAAMLGALDGPSGLTATSAAIGLRGLAFRGSAAAYKFTDEMQAKALDSIRWMAGAAVASNPGTAALAALVGGGAIAADVYANYGGDWQKWLVNHPGAIDTLLGMTPGMLTDLGIPSDLASTMQLLAAAYPDGDPKLIDQGVDPAMSGDHPPQGLGDIVDGLGYRNDHNSDKPGEGSNIDVRAVRDASGNVTGYIVDIPGTKVWNLPGQDGGNANDFGTNIDAMAGNPTVLEKGLEQAMRDADIPPGAPVMLVGHSQGGIVAARAAQDFTANGEFNVTHVVTAGSPIGRIDIPPNVQVLSLENSGDIVPHLDASDNPDAPNRTTVVFDNQTNTVGGNHSIGNNADPGQDTNYSQVAHQLDTSNDPSVRQFVTSAGAFTNGSTVDTHQYKVERQR